jgi:hypothetical protein
VKSALLLLIPFAVHANEAQLACNLERSKAEVQASTLSAPAAYGSAGQDTNAGDKNVIVGISQSFSGRSQASLIREAAQAKCDAIKATTQLDEHARFAVLQVRRDAAIAELSVVERAILLAKSNIALLDEQLRAQVITINQHTEARQVLFALEARQANLLRTLSVVVVPPQNATVQSLLEVSRISESQAARLSAKASAETGWDVVILAGGRQPLTGDQKANAFGTITFKYSFGTSSAQDAAKRVGTDTAALLAAQQGGYTQTIIRQRQELQSLIETETLASATSSRQLAHLNQVLSSLVGLDTVLALNTRRVLDLQIKSLEADLASANVRLAGFTSLLETLK